MFYHWTVKEIESALKELRAKNEKLLNRIFDDSDRMEDVEQPLRTYYAEIDWLERLLAKEAM